MKVVHLSWEFPPTIVGGLGTFAMELTRQLILKGNEVIVFTLNKDNEYPTVSNWKGVEIHRPKTIDFTDGYRVFADGEVANWGPGLKFFSDVITYNILSACKFVNQIVKANGRRYNLIDAHDWLGALGGVAIKKELDIPFIFHVHATEKGRSMGKGSRTVEEIEYMGAENATLIITVSNAMKEHLLSLGYPEDKIRVCWNGVDSEKYDMNRFNPEDIEKLRASYGITCDKKMLLFIGRLTGVKGSRHLIRAMPSIIEEFPDAKLVVLGVGELEGDLRFLIKKLRLEDNVILRTEFVDEELRILHYAASDIVVLPSLYEPFGIVCTEAMSMKKPVVVGARGISGMREQIIPKGDGQCGVHINPSDEEDIAWGVKELLRDEEQMKKMGENSRKRVLKEFTWDKIAERTLNIYNEAIDIHG